MRALPILIAALLNVGCASRSELPLHTASDGPCVPFGGVSASQTWVTGDYKVVPVAAEHQAQIMQRLQRGAVEEVDKAVAKAVTGNATLPQVAHYYLVRVGYVGDAPHGAVPAGVSIRADVNSEGVAYVSSFVLSRSDRTSELAAILTSPTPLRRIVSTCGAAE